MHTISYLNTKITLVLFFIIGLSFYFFYALFTNFEEGRLEAVKKQYYNKIKHSYEKNYIVNLQEHYENEARAFVDTTISELVANGQREKLFSYAAKHYEELLRKDSYVVLAHFHSADGTTLLRLHNPKHYGDKIANKRKLVATAHEQKHPLSAFENGTSGLQFRVLIPIYHKREYVGAFEIGVSPKKLLDYVSKFNNLEGYIKLEDRENHEALFKTNSLEDYEKFLPAQGEKITKESLSIIEKRYVARYSFSITGLEKDTIGEFVFFQDLSKYYNTHYDMIEKAVVIFLFMGISLFFLLAYLMYLSAKNASNLKSRSQLMLNAQENMVVITKLGEDLVEVNRVFLEFFGFDTLAEFHKHYRCICERFIAGEGYLQKEMDGLNWVLYILAQPQRRHLAKIANRDAEEHYFRVHATPLDEKSLLREYVVTFEDITQELEVQQTLEFERDLFSAGPVITIEWSPKNNWPIRYVSANVTKELGYTPEEMQEQSFIYAELIHPDDLERIFAEVKEYIESKTLYYEQSYRLRLKSGEYRWFYDFSNLIFDESAELLTIRGYMFDQSEMKKAQELLAEQKERLQNIIDGTNVGTWEWNIKSGETVFNEKWAQMIGYSLEEISPTTIDTWTGFANAEDLKASENSLLETLSGKREFYEAKCRMRHRNGEEIWIYDRGKVVKWGENGEALVMSGTHTNIDTEVRAQRQLQELNKNLQKAVAAKSQFLANMSHEIRTPMNAILGLSELLKDTELNPKQLDFLEKIHGSSQMLLRIINDILDFSKIEAGKLELESKPFALESIFSQMRVLFLEQSQKKGLELTCHIEKGTPSVIVGDMLRLEQVVSNLLSNAIKFTHRGSVTLKIGLKERRDESRATLRISVEDSGIGISKEESERLFLPFSQADSSTTRKFGGTGLGLVISSKIINAMGSKIELESEVNVGSRFFFDIECGVESWEELDAESLKREHQKNENSFDIEQTFEGSSVLLVEDNELNIEVASLMLERCGVDVIVAKNGAEGVSSYFSKREEIDLILMDLQMPVMDGYEATQEIRKEDSIIPIIALTAAAMSEDKERVKNSGMNAHLSKPLESDALYRVLAEYLSSKVTKADAEFTKEFVQNAIKKLQESTILAQHEQESLLAGIKKVFHGEEYLAFVSALDDLELEEAALILSKNIDLIT